MSMDLYGPGTARASARRLAACCGVPCLMLAASLGHAQPPSPADPANPAASVPLPAYQSPFSALPRGVETSRTDWRSANQAVGRFPRGHLDLLKAEEAASAAPQAPAATVPPAATGARQP